jgi:acetylornithine deacetylase ArgE
MVDAVMIAAQLVRIPSENSMGHSERAQGTVQTGEERLTDFLQDFFHSYGIPSICQEVSPGRRNILAYIGFSGARRTMLLDAHQDTVPADSMTIPPFAGEIREGKLWGRGACDVKGGMAAMLAAICRISDEKRSGASVILACTVDEEHTFRGVQRLLCGPWPIQRPDMAVVAEPTGLNVVIAHKGLTRWKIATRGKSCHSANPQAGDNAIYRMAPIVTILEQYSEALEKGASHPLLGSPTLSVGTIRGGEGVNMVPPSCEIEIDRRLIPGEDPREAFNECRRMVLSQLGAGFPVEFEEPWLAEPALDTPMNAEVSQISLTAVTEVMGTASFYGVPYGTDASTISAGGIPSIVLGPGDIAQAHTQDEWIEVEQIEKAAEVYYKIIRSAGTIG